MGYRRERILNDDDIEAGIEECGTIAAYAARMGCTPALVSARLSRLRHARGDFDSRDVDSIEAKIRYRPTRAQVKALFATHGNYACVERWGATAATLLKTAR